ncbi:MAG: hypothetical protein H0V37_09125 [Chloroflexia bacterium]|nr:hypothetical protein [Chloroflexia bacterium]
MRPDQTLNRPTTRTRLPIAFQAKPRQVVVRCLLVAAFFGIAFAIDQFTGQRFSAI